MIDKINSWHKTRIGYLCFALFELLLAFVFVGFAIGGGNLWDYLLTLVLLVGFLQNLFKFANTFGRRRRAQ